MTDDEELMAREVHTLLLVARPESDDRNFASAAELALSGNAHAVRQRDDFKAEVLLAIKEVEKAITEGAGLFERKRRHRHAVNSAHSWLNARRFPPY